MNAKKSKKINKIIKEHKLDLLSKNPHAVVDTRLIQTGSKPGVTRDDSGNPKLIEHPVYELLNPFRRIKNSYKKEHRHGRRSKIVKRKA